jgi:hypothetical protein
MPNEFAFSRPIARGSEPHGNSPAMEATHGISVWLAATHDDFLRT